MFRLVGHLQHIEAWYDQMDCIILPNKRHLTNLIVSAKDLYLPHGSFFEPDILDHRYNTYSMYV
jgi:hypothetical protein